MTADFDAMPAAFWVAVSDLVGAILGSFRGVVVYLLPVCILEDTDTDQAWTG